MTGRVSTVTYRLTSNLQCLRVRHISDASFPARAPLYCPLLDFWEKSMLHRLLFGLVAVASLTWWLCPMARNNSAHNQLNGPITAVGQGQPVVVRVADGRPSPVLGTGVVYPETSAISVSGRDILPSCRPRLKRLCVCSGLPQRQCPTPSVDLDPGRAEVPVAEEGLYVTGADMTATFRVDVQNTSRRYGGRYGASLNQRFGMAPNQATNTSW